MSPSAIDDDFDTFAGGKPDPVVETVTIAGAGPAGLMMG